MTMIVRAVALWCVVLFAARASAYTVDCNHEYTDCDTELSKYNVFLYNRGWWKMSENLGLYVFFNAKS